LPVEKGAQRIIDDILREAKEESAKIIAAAKTEAKTLLDAAHLRARESEEFELKKAREQGKQIYDQMLAEGRMRARREMLQKREEMINEVFRKTEGLLKKHVSSREYEKNLVRMVVDACKKLGSREAVIRVNRRDLKTLEGEREKLAKELGEGFTLGDPIQTIGGVRTETPDGKIVIDETFENRMKRGFESLRIKVAKILFEGFK
jgi:V/A-type H+-transporting ATPase subunit E